MEYALYDIISLAGLSMNIDIICPLYEAEKYLAALHGSFLMQKNVDIKGIRYVLTESLDRSEEILRTLGNCTWRKINKKDFSHSLTREEEALSSGADIIVFVSQDVRIVRDDWLENLVKPIIKGECDASFSRQICDDDSIEKYIRERNYPDVSRTVSMKDVFSLGLNAFFFSNAAGAIRRDVFEKLGGYDHKDFRMSEDMYFAYKLITNGYKIRYCADSEVIHYHHKTLGELYERYCQIGEFFKDNPYLDKYNVRKSGSSLASYVLKRSLKEGNVKVLMRWLPDMAARYLGYNKGKKKTAQVS